MSDSSYALAEPQEAIPRSTYGRIGVALSSMLFGFGLGCVALNVLGRNEESLTLWATAPSRSANIAPGSGGPWKELALAAIEANNRCEVGGLKPTPRFTAAMANMRNADLALPFTRAGQQCRGSQAVQARKAQSFQ